MGAWLVGRPPPVLWLTMSVALQVPLVGVRLVGARLVGRPPPVVWLEDDAVVGDTGPGDPDGSGQDGSGQDGSGQVGSGQDGSDKEGSDNEAGLGNSWYEYAVLLQDVQATALIGSLKGKRVYLPYRPMSKHA